MEGEYFLCEKLDDLSQKRFFHIAYTLTQYLVMNAVFVCVFLNGIFLKTLMSKTHTEKSAPTEKITIKD